MGICPHHSAHISYNHKITMRCSPNALNYSLILFGHTCALNVPPSRPIYLYQINYYYCRACKQGPCYLATPVSKEQHVGNCVRLHSPGSFIETSVHWPLFFKPLQIKCFTCTFDSLNWQQKSTVTYGHLKMLHNWPHCGFKIRVALSCAVLGEPDMTLSLLNCLIINKTLEQIW